MTRTMNSSHSGGYQKPSGSLCGVAGRSRRPTGTGRSVGTNSGDRRSGSSRGGLGVVTVMVNRRERVRAATVQEIKDVARRQLVGDGPSAVSLRAIAREMGMTAPALYRYFPSFDH